MTKYTALVYLPNIYADKDTYLVYAVDLEGYYLICGLQTIGYKNLKLDFECEKEPLNQIKVQMRYQMYYKVMEWLIKQGQAIRFDNKPCHLILKLNE
jgi:hypothetical protein